MNASIQHTASRRRRGKILSLLKASSPLAISDDKMLYRLLDDWAESLTIGDVHELLRDLKERGCLRYEQKRTPEDELPLIRWIRLEPRGRDILEGTIQDPAIDLI